MSTGFVYFVQRGADGPIKIGYAVKVGRRIDQLQTACAEPLRLLATLPALPMMERELHEKFSDLAIGGEWFRPAPPIFQFLAKRIANASIRSERPQEQLRLVTPPSPPKPPPVRHEMSGEELAKAAAGARRALRQRCAEEEAKRLGINERVRAEWVKRRVGEMEEEHYAKNPHLKRYAVGDGQ
jgi:hypothetical protein